MLLKKRYIVQLAALLLITAFVVAVGACPSDELFAKRVGDLDTTALTAKIAEANAAKAGVVMASAETEVNLGVTWVTSRVMTTFENAIEAAKQVNDNIEAAKQVKDNATIQEEVDSAVTILNATITTFNGFKKTGTKLSLILNELNNKINDANNAKIGVNMAASAGDVPLGMPYVTPDEMYAFDTAITDAKTARNAATQTEVDNAVNDLEGAIDIFNTAKQKTGSKVSGFTVEDLTKLIDSAKAAKVGVEIDTASTNVAQGTNWVTEGVMTNFDTKITAAENALTGTQTEIDTAVANLSDAIINFGKALQPGTKVDYGQLSTMIANAKAAKAVVVINTNSANVNPGTYWVTQGVMDTFDRAISDAESALRATTQAEVNTAATTLQTAIATFNSARQTGTKVDISVLNGVIAQANAEKVGVVINTASANVDVGVKWVTQAIMNTFNSAISTAETARGETTQAAVDSAVTALQGAIDTFTKAQGTGTKTAGPVGPVDPSTTIDYESEGWGSHGYAPLTLGLVPGNTTAQILLTWYSSGGTSGKSAQVRFIEGTKNAGVALLTGTGGAVSTAGSNTAHKVTVNGLKPGASYQYSVSGNGTIWSPMYNFKVPAATGAWKFAVISDPQLTLTNVDSNSRYPASSVTTANSWIETMNKVVAAEVSFIVSGGDQVDTASSQDQYTRFFAPSGLRSLPLAPVVGNHDPDATVFKSHFNLPNDQNPTSTDTGVMANYYYLYNNILFVGLNTSAYPGSRSAAAPYKTRFEDTIKAAKNAHAGKYDWLIVHHHKSTASVAEHLADADIQYFVEAGFESVMSDQGVDFVLAGHDHVYARSWPLAGRDQGKVSVPDKTAPGPNNTFTNPGNPIYLTLTTGSGLKYYKVNADTTFVYNGELYNKNNAVYPYLGESTAGDGSTYFGSSQYINNKRLPVSNAAYVQAFIPSYTIVEVNNNPAVGSRSITFKTYPIATKSGQNAGASQPYSFNENTPYDTVTVVK